MTMKKDILDRIQALGGDISQVSGVSLQDDLQSITFNTVLYPRPVDTPWEKAEDAEPIYGLGAFVEAHMALYQADKNAFYEKMIAHYYRLTEEPYGQHFWIAQPFTPYKQGTADNDEWYADFADPDEVDLQEITAFTGDDTPDFIRLFYAYGYPDNLYITLSDPNPDNPTLFGTDHEVFFREITNEGTLADYLNTFLTPDELIALGEKTINKPQQG